MSDSNTLRILEIDGGGERGYLPLNFFSLFVERWGVDPATIWQQFDVICGTSIGGIIALGLAFGLTPAQLMPFFTVQGPYIFSLSSLTPSFRPNLAAKLALIATDTPFYQSSGPTAASYGAGLLYATLQTTFGTNTLQNLKTNVIIPSYQSDNTKYVLFSNLNYPDFIGNNELISNVAIATSAAPIYLPSLSLNNHVYLDGGVYQNNPASLGVTLAKMLKPNYSRICVLSLGTGIGEMGFDPGLPSIINPNLIDNVKVRAILENNPTPNAFDSISTIFSLFDIAATGGQESIAKALYLQSTYTLDQFYYYRFQPMLDINLNTELDNTDPDILTYYQNLASTSFNSDIENISIFLGHLTA
jgi:patatin-like phospholipase/acyl hydrolase